MVNCYVMKSEHDLFVDCLPYEWWSGTSDGLFLPIYPPRSMHWLLCFDDSKIFAISIWVLMTDVESMDYTHSHPSTIASLSCVVQLSPVPYTHHTPSSKQPPYLPIMAFPLPFWDIFPCNFPPFCLLWHTSSLTYYFSWSCSWHIICGKATFHNSFIHVTLDSLHIPVHRQRHSHRVIFCSKYWFVIFEL